MLEQLSANSIKATKSVKNKRWAKATLDDNLAKFIAAKTGLPLIVAEVLARRNVEPDDAIQFLNPKLRDCMPNPNSLQDMERGVEVVIETIQKEKQVTVFGDYDVDGATSTALLLRAFRALGHDKVGSYIPDRINEGYGLNEEAVKLLHSSGTQLLITVDCGSTAHDAIALANSLGMQVVVIDHHLCSSALPPAAAVINPNRQDDTSDLGYLAAVGVSFLFAIALTKRCVELSFVPASKLQDLILLLDIVALGTVCDVVPLKGFNRVIVKQGIKVIQARLNRGIKSLLDASQVETHVGIDTYHLGFVIGPKINAGGRVGQADLGAKLLASDDAKQCHDLAIRLLMHNHERRAIEIRILDEALAQASMLHRDAPVACICGEDWHQGVIGIVAARVKEKLGKPAIVATIDEDGRYKASCRSIRGIDIGQAIIEAKNKGLLVAGGGHAMAAGFTAERASMEDLKAFLTEKFQDKYKELNATTVSHYDGLLSIEAVTDELARHVCDIGPFGTDNETPIFMLTNVSIVATKILKGEHLSCILKDYSTPLSTKTIKGMCFRGIQSPLGEVLLAKRPNMNLIVTVSLNTWKGKNTAEVVILDAMIGSS